MAKMTEEQIKEKTLEVQKEMAAVINSVKMYKWRIYSKWLSAPMNDISNDFSMQLFVAAAEKREKELGYSQDNLDVIDQMSLEDITTYLGFPSDDQEVTDEDDKS